MMKSNYYNKKCKGCGQFFSDDINSPSYVVNPNENTLYCKRCFQIKHYKKINNEHVDEQKITETINNIDIKDNFLIVVVDLFDIYNTLIDQYKDYKNKIIVINKLGVLPKKFNSNITLEKISKIVDSKNILYKDIILYDSINHININRIYKYINEASRAKKITYVFGKTNTGKSSLINALLKLNKEKDLLTVSPYKNTTLNLSKITIERNTIIDTPGIPNQDSLLNLVSEKDIDKINNNTKFVSKNFQVKNNNQTYFVEGLCYLNVKSIYDNASLNFYIKQNIKVHSTKFDKVNNVLNNQKKIFNINLVQKNLKFIKHSYKLNINVKYNIFLNGLCLVSLKNVEIIEIYLPEKVNVYITDNAVI